jgi:hypothetical protein
MKLSDYQQQTEALTQNNEMLQEAIKEANLRSEKLADHVFVSEFVNFSSDLSRLFIHYHVEPFLKTIAEYREKYATWQSFKGRLTVMKREMKEGRIPQSELDQFVAPLQDKLTSLNMEINVLQLHELINQRNTMTQESIRTIEEQQKFLDHLDEYTFTQKFIYEHMAKQMLALLKETQLRRFVN